MVNKAQIKLKFRWFFFYFSFFFFCRLVLKCFIYREMINIKDHKLSEFFLTVGLVEPIKFVLRSVIYIISATVSDMLNSHKFSEKNCKILKTKLVRSIFIYLEFQKKSSVTALRKVLFFKKKKKKKKKNSDTAQKKKSFFFFQTKISESY